MARLIGQRHRPVGIITRADTTRAAPSVFQVQRTAKQAAEALSEVPKLHRDAARDIEVLERLQARFGYVHSKHRADAMDAASAIREALVEELAGHALALDEVYRGDPNATSAYIDVHERARRFARLTGHRERIAYFEQALERARRLSFRRWGPGPGGGVRVDPVAPPSPSPVSPGAPPPLRPPGPSPVRPGPVGPPPGPAPIGPIPTPGPPGPPGAPPAIPPGVSPRPRLPGGFGPPAAPPRPGVVDQALGAGRQLPGVATMLAAGGLWSLVRGSMGRAERYETALSRLAAQRGRLGRRAGGGSMASDPWFARRLPQRGGGSVVVSSRRASAGVLELRHTMNALRESFLLTGAEALEGMRALDYHLAGSSGHARALAVGQMARRTGLGLGEVGGFYHRSLMYVSDGRPVALDAPRELQPIGSARTPEGPMGARGAATPSPFGRGPAEGVVARSMLQDMRRAMNYAGWQSRPQEFMGDVQSTAQALGEGQGLGDYRDAIGLTTMLAMRGIGGTAGMQMGARIVQGTASTSSDAITAAKIAAVRKHLGTTRIGRGEYAETLDPWNVRDAMRLIESGDPRVTAAFARYSESKADGDEEVAKDGFQRLLEGKLSTREVEHLWGMRGDLDRVRHLADGAPEATEAYRDGRAPTERWMSGPLIKGESGWSDTGIARQRAELDVVQHRAGIALLDTARDIKDGVLIAADGFVEGASPADAIMNAIDSLNPSTKLLLGLGAALQGGPAGKLTAAAMAESTVTSSLDDFMRAANAQIAPVREFFGIETGAGALHRPLEGGRVSGHFGEDRGTHDHAGLDLAAPAGTPVEAAGAGTVQFAGRRGAYGNLVVIEHDDGETTTRYGHMRDLAVRRGDRVQAGTQLGTVGSTGRSTGPHLHFEVQRAGRRVDPLPLIGEAH